MIIPNQIYPQLRNRPLSWEAMDDDWDPFVDSSLLYQPTINDAIDLPDTE